MIFINLEIILRPISFKYVFIWLQRWNILRAIKWKLSYHIITVWLSKIRASRIDTKKGPILNYILSECNVYCYVEIYFEKCPFPCLNWGMHAFRYNFKDNNACVTFPDSFILLSHVKYTFSRTKYKSKIYQAMYKHFLIMTLNQWKHVHISIFCSGNACLSLIKILIAC